MRTNLCTRDLLGYGKVRYRFMRAATTYVLFVHLLVGLLPYSRVLRMTLALPRSSHPRESPRTFVPLFPMLPFVYNILGLPLESNILVLCSDDALRSDVSSSSLRN